VREHDFCGPWLPLGGDHFVPTRAADAAAAAAAGGGPVARLAAPLKALATLEPQRAGASEPELVHEDLAAGGLVEAEPPQGAAPAFVPAPDFEDALTADELIESELSRGSVLGL
jgi:hypothetical protein